MLDKVKKSLKEAIENIGKVYEYSSNKNTPFPEIGIDSIDYVEMVIFCEESLEIEMLEREIDWSKISTPDSLIYLILEILKSVVVNKSKILR